MHSFRFPRRFARLLAFLFVLAFSALTPVAAQPRLSDGAFHEHAGVGSPAAPVPYRATLSDAEWKAFGQRLARTLTSAHEGLPEDALRLMIQYGPRLEMGRTAVLDVVRVYRDHPNENLRRMAVVALGRMGNAWSFDFLERSLPYEKSPAVRHTLQAVLAAHAAPPSGALAAAQ